MDVLYIKKIMKGMLHINKNSLKKNKTGHLKIKNTTFKEWKILNI